MFGVQQPSTEVGCQIQTCGASSRVPVWVQRPGSGHGDPHCLAGVSRSGVGGLLAQGLTFPICKMGSATPHHTTPPGSTSPHNHLRYPVPQFPLTPPSRYVPYGLGEPHN